MNLQKHQVTEIIEQYEDAQKMIDQLCCYDIIGFPSAKWRELSEYAALEMAVNAVVKSGKRDAGEIVRCVLSAFINAMVAREKSDDEKAEP